MPARNTRRPKRTRRRKQAELGQAERRATVASLYLMGKRQDEIAAQLGVAQGTVSKDLAAIQAEWQAAAIADLSVRKTQELARLDELEREAWRAWERSQQPREKVTSVPAKRTRAGQVPAWKPKEIERTGQCGDPRFLEQVGRCIKQRCEILGLLKEQLDVHIQGPACKVYIGIDPELM